MFSLFKFLQNSQTQRNKHHFRQPSDELKPEFMEVGKKSKGARVRLASLRPDGREAAPTLLHKS
jgi:hypothetical protein